MTWVGTKIDFSWLIMKPYFSTRASVLWENEGLDLLGQAWEPYPAHRQNLWAASNPLPSQEQWDTIEDVQKL